jgi:diacylglycerol kinase (ATP)
VEKLILGLSLVLILIMELVNTAIETVINRISSERHPLSKKAKDIGSLLVLISFVWAAAAWIIILSVNF